MTLLLLVFSIPLFLSILTQNVNGIYVPKVYGHVNAQKCIFISEGGEEHQIYKFGQSFMFGRVFLLDEHNAKILNVHNNCPEVNVLDDLQFHENRIEFKQVHDDQSYPQNYNAIMAMDDDGIWRVQNGGLDYPFYSCQSLMRSSPNIVDKSLCSVEHFFYLKESREGNVKHQQLLALKVAREEDMEKFEAFFGQQQIEPVGLSEFVKASKTLKSLLKKLTETAEEKALREQIEKEAKKAQNDWKVEKEAEKAERSKINEEKEKILHGMKPMIYKGLAFFLKRLTCDLPTHTNNTLTAQSKNAAFQMKLICEDIKEILVQITKGHLDKGKLTVNDLDAKLGGVSGKAKKAPKIMVDRILRPELCSP